MANQKSTTTSSGGDSRARNWNIIVWEESAPPNWRELITKTGPRWFESPIHDRDMLEPDEETGEVKAKKPHWHCTLIYRNKKSYKQIKELLESLGSNQIPLACGSVEHSLRYMAHMDDPEKAQYDMNKIVGHCGANVLDFLRLTRSEVSRIKRQIRAFIWDNDISEYSDLMRLLDQTDMLDWIDVAENNTIHFNALLASRRGVKEKVAGGGKSEA